MDSGSDEQYAEKMSTGDTYILYIFHRLMSKQNTFFQTETEELILEGKQVSTKLTSKETFKIRLRFNSN